MHADVFYQQDAQFAKLDPKDKLFRPQELSKKRGQPVNLDYEVTFLTKYREDLDQIISNFSVHFRPDIYLKWWHPRNKKEPLTAQMTWAHNVSLDNGVDYNPANVHLYKGTTSFKLKTWLFLGMHATDNAIDSALESVIKKVKFFPNRTGEDYDMNPADDNEDTDAYVFGDIGKKDEGTLGFWGVQDDQDFVGSDVDKMKNGDYAVNNVFAADYPAISGDSILSSIHTNPNVGDIFSNYDKDNINDFSKYQIYLHFDTAQIKTGGNAFVKNVYYKGSYPASAFYLTPPSGDYLFKTFFSIQDNAYGITKKKEFGSSFLGQGRIEVNYDVTSKDLTFSCHKDEDWWSFYMKSNFNSTEGSGNGYFQEFSMKAKSFRGIDPGIYYSLHYEFSKDLDVIEDKTFKDFSGIELVNDKEDTYKTKLEIEDFEYKSKLLKIRNIITSHWKSLNLIEKNSDDGIWWIEIEDRKLGQILKAKDIYDINWRSLKLSGKTYSNGYYYNILLNKYIYMVLKVNGKNENDCEMYDWRSPFPIEVHSRKSASLCCSCPKLRRALRIELLPRSMMLRKEPSQKHC